MKKILTMLLAAAMLFTLAACGTTPNEADNNKNNEQELLCKGWFLPPNTYDCGSFVVNETAVVGKEQNNPYNH